MASRDLDYDEEAKKLFERLNLMNASTKPAIYNPMDPIWRDPKTGGTIFVGNQTAAANKSLLDSNGITHVVNCTDNMPQYHQNANTKAPITYMRFPISFWMRHENQLPEFIRPLITFVDGALAKGENVLVHCLAGAHRAGTTGCLLLMYKAGMPRMEAIRSAKKLRPVIDPIGGLPELLKRYEELRNAGKL
ncbi:hypothetical protein AB1Y20_001723 [Prymnesium parvum]|uniref:protein-tyrosine-phosphatase n=1 Tax=Prymnesium parvum TaxID=97485 RepID=A0AB34KBN8_PRYPA